MKDLPVEELAAISVEICEAAQRIGCTHVSLTGQIWPGGRLSGPPAEAARFAEYSWLKAAVIDGHAIFEEADPQRYAALLNAYGLGDEPALEPERQATEVVAAPVVNTPAPSGKLALNTEVLPATRRELERQAAAEGLSVGELLDWKFQPHPGR